MKQVIQNKHTSRAPEISVIVPAYNTQNYLMRCLDSLLAQNFSDFEVIFVDDGSVDTSFEVFEQYLSRFPHATLIQQHNQGLSKARNTGIEHAKGNYISFVDSDDWVAPTMLQTLFAAITETESDIAQIAYESCSDPHYVPKQVTHDKQRILSSKEALCEMFTDEKYSVWCRLYARRLFDNDQEVFPVGLTCEDRVANFKLISRAKQVVVSERIEYFYFLNYGSISFSGLDRRGFDLLEADMRIVKMAKKLGDPHLLTLVEDRAAKGSFSLLIKWARFGITDADIGEHEVKSLMQDFQCNYPRLSKSSLSPAKKFVAWQLRYMPRILKAEFRLYNMISSYRRRIGSP